MNRYIISDAAKLLDVESHVLRNWEDELSLHIPRNEIGHRLYTDDNIEELKLIKKLKFLGFSLKHIKLLLPYMTNLKELDDNTLKILHNKLTIELSPNDNLSHINTYDNLESIKHTLNDTLTNYFNNYLYYLSQEFINHTTDTLNKTLSFHLSKQQAYIQEYYNLLHKNKKIKK